MSFFSGSGFGANNNQNQTTNNAFSGFGQNNNTNNTTGGFGSSTNTGFGSTNNAAGGSLFGGTNTSGGFGGFGANNNNNQPSTGFGDRPAFGAASTSTGGSLFGGNPTTTSSGFGSLATNNTNTGFGSSANTGGLFGQPAKPAFGTGATTSTGTSLFGSQNTSTGFGSGTTNTTTGFGAANSTGFGASQNQAQNQGTGSTPFQAHVEQEATGGGKAQYQSIVFQQPYQTSSFEELRLADYNQGRKWGNQGGQAGAFGASTGFGGFTGTTNNNPGFGSTNSGGGLFGQGNSNANNSTPFGSSSTNAFGSNTGGTGLFGSSKPANLFGSTSTTSGTASGSLFGTANNTTANTGFGTTSGFGTANTGQSLFGNTNTNPPKTGFGFGTNNTATPAGFGQQTGTFGQTTSNNTGGSIFGNNNANNSNTNAFGQNQANTNSSGFGTFGQTNNQNQNSTAGGSLFGGGGSGFGTNNNQNQAKPSLFGTGGSLFGNTQTQQQQPQPGGIFGNAASAGNNQQSTSLFGAKPATGTSLFGPTNNASNTGGGLFNLGNQQSQGTSLFGNANQAQQKPNLFGSTNNNTSGGSLFGGLGSNTNSQSLGSSLFNNNNQGQQSQFGGGLFGSQQNQQQTQQPQQLMTSINSTNPYGNEHLFVSLATPPQSVGPLATPLSSSQKARKPAPLPTFKLNPAASSRLITPQKRNGYGFSYSNYGTPGSATSNASSSPFSSGLLASGNLGRTLNKSFSTNNLRSTLGGGDSILAPGAFSPSGARSFMGSGSIKKLNINRTLRTDLFGTESSSEKPRPSPLKKRVSFENEANHTNEINGQTSTALVRVDDRDSETPQAEDHSARNAVALVNNAQSNGLSQSEMTQVKGNELAIVPEDGPPPVPSKRAAKTAAENARLSQTDVPPGNYYTIPSMAELRRMTRSQLSSVKPFTVGREGSGKIEFSNANLSDVDLSTICDNIVKITTRKATVYVDNLTKPPPGKQLNVPSIVTLANSWPRAKGGRLPVYEKKGPRFEKHILRLKRVDGTEFIDYNEKTGEWSFRVNHFSTYALNYEEDESFMSSMLTPPPDTPAPKSSVQGSRQSQDDSPMMSEHSSAFNPNVDDTFAFRSRKSLPGAFDEDGVSDYEDEMSSPQSQSLGFAPSIRANEDSVMENGVDNVSGIIETQHENDHNLAMAGSFPSLDGSPDVPTGPSPQKLKSIMKQSHQFFPALGLSPSRDRTMIGEDWAQQLQRTISPKKQDRQLLREFQGSIRKPSPEFGKPTAAFDKSVNPFATSIDVMNSLFGKDGEKKGRKTAEQDTEANFSKWPGSKQLTVHDNLIGEADQPFRESIKPTWTSVHNAISFSANHKTPEFSNSMFGDVLQPFEFGGSVVRFGGFTGVEKDLPTVFQEQRALTDIRVEHGVPRAYLRSDFAFSTFASLIDGTDSKSQHERLMWQLAGILFDEAEIEELNINNLDEDVARERLRKQKFSKFWKDLVYEAAERHAQKASSAEEKALAFVSGERVPEACKALLEGRDYRLATQLSLIGGDMETKKGIAAQIDEWRRVDSLSEITAPIRALYELLAGNAGLSAGKTGAGPENRAESFKISSRFGLDWRRSFGLRLWYVITPDETIGDAVNVYKQAQEDGDEDIKPIPWFVEQDLDVGWEDPDLFTREDILWGLLTIFAYKDELDRTTSAKLEDIIAPHNISGNPMDSRVSFQLYQCLHARGIAEFSKHLRDQMADQLASDYAFQLTNSGHLAPAIFVSLHISDPNGRRAAIEALLSLCAAHSSVEELEEISKDLGSAFKIPEEWFWAAKAPFIKTVDKDEVALVKCLLRAGEIREAHNVLKTSVAPRAVIEEDLHSLKQLIAAWDPELRTMDVLPEWGLGGAVYVDYIQLLELRKKGMDTLTEKSKLVERIVNALSAIGSQSPGLEELVAISEMSKLVLDISLDLEAAGGMVEPIERARLRALPVPRDGVLEEIVRFSSDYYIASAFAA